MAPYPRACVDSGQVVRFARELPGVSAVKPFDFCSAGEGTLYPPRHATGVVDFFFFACAHQYGFWTLDDDRYAGPMIARIDGVEAKGSDFLTRALMRHWRRDPGFAAPTKLAILSDDDCAALFHDDAGTNPLPLWDTHLAIIRGYTRWFIHAGTTPAALLAKSRAAEKPLAALLAAAGVIPGYSEDPLRKKLMLLAMILANRPERFLPVRDPESAIPIIDYHLQRSALRTGLVRVEDAALRAHLEQRRLLDAEAEAEIRQSTYAAIQQLMAASGLGIAEIDWFFFSNRTRCPEMSEPRCAECPVTSICRQDTAMFQPVFRTTAY